MNAPRRHRLSELCADVLTRAKSSRAHRERLARILEDATRGRNANIAAHLGRYVALDDLVPGSQDEYCRDCAHAGSCNVMLKDGEECGDRFVPTYQAHADASVRLDIEPEADPRLSGISIPPVGGQPGRTIYGDWND